MVLWWCWCEFYPLNKGSIILYFTLLPEAFGCKFKQTKLDCFVLLCWKWVKCSKFKLHLYFWTLDIMQHTDNPACAEIEGYQLLAWILQTEFININVFIKEHASQQDNGSSHWRYETGPQVSHGLRLYMLNTVNSLWSLTKHMKQCCSLHLTICGCIFFSVHVKVE